MKSAERLDNLFKNAELFNGDLSKWFVKPTSMDGTFYGASSFTGRRGLRSWDTSQVNDMHRVFAYSKFQGDISSWGMNFVTTTRQMFLGCQSFDGDVSKWDVSNVSLLSFCAFSLLSRSLLTLPSTIQQVKDFSSMFEGANVFSSDLSKWDVSSGAKFDRMFASAESFNKDISMWKITSARSMSEIFANATLFSKDLCAWGPQLKSNLDMKDDLDMSHWYLFEGSRCPAKSSLPNFLENPPGPFCHQCT